MNLNATLFLQLVVFLILGGFTMKFVWPPIVKALDERAKKIADGLNAAEKAKSDLALADRKAVEELRKAREKGVEIRANAERQAGEKVEEARAEAARIVAQAREAALAEASLAAQQARDALRDQVAQLAVAGAEKILRREINPQVHADLLANLKQELQ
ncbi:MAG: F0F1 ATP synthase subunit B [Azoarcus sp.]|nr:F0F1 ATP synthase subunit B [Azoarcus sp.]